MDIFIIIIIAAAIFFGILYFVIKNAVTDGITQAYYDMRERYQKDIKNAVKFGIKEANKEIEEDK